MALLDGPSVNSNPSRCVPTTSIHAHISIRQHSSALLDGSSVNSNPSRCLPACVYMYTSAYVSITRWLFCKLKSIKVSACVYIHICTCAKCQVGITSLVVLHVMRWACSSSYSVICWRMSLAKPPTYTDVWGFSRDEVDISVEVMRTHISVKVMRTHY